MVCCKRKNKATTRAFYYWKTTLQLSTEEKKTLSELKVTKLYVRYFDIGLNDQKNPFPISNIVGKELIDNNISVVPTIFITNETMLKMENKEIPQLAKNIITQINLIHIKVSAKSFTEIQLDCDWSTNSRQNYFLLLQEIKKILPNVIINCTLRLHQLADIHSTGVPPADKVTLMLYNMGNLKDIKTKNSIIDPSIVDAYTKNCKYYSLPIDIALPLFRWGVIYRNNIYIGLLRINSTDDLKKYTSLGENWYRVDTIDTDANKFLLPGDKIRYEYCSFKDINNITKKVSKHINNSNKEIIFFHLDEKLLKDYSINQLENIFSEN